MPIVLENNEPIVRVPAPQWSNPIGKPCTHGHITIYLHTVYCATFPLKTVET